jgi:uncharacterized coiled-coil protein SlyX
MSTETLEHLETKIAFLERANNELSDVVYQQHREIESLRARLEALADRVSAALESPETPRTPEDERPPHY